MRYLFEGYALDTDRRELHRGTEAVSIAPQEFDLLDYLIRNRERVVSKDDIIKVIWKGRAISDTALTTRLDTSFLKPAALGAMIATARLVRQDERSAEVMAELRQRLV